MAGEKNKVCLLLYRFTLYHNTDSVLQKLQKSKTAVYVSLPPRRTRSGGQMKTEERVKASAEKTIRKALVEGRGVVKLGSHRHVYVGGVRPLLS